METITGTGRGWSRESAFRTWLETDPYLNKPDLRRPWDALQTNKPVLVKELLPVILPKRITTVMPDRNGSKRYETGYKVIRKSTGEAISFPEGTNGLFKETSEGINSRIYFTNQGVANSAVRDLILTNPDLYVIVVEKVLVNQDPVIMEIGPWGGQEGEWKFTADFDYGV